jgi:hypothetical protein
VFEVAAEVVPGQWLTRKTAPGDLWCLRSEAGVVSAVAVTSVRCGRPGCLVHVEASLVRLEAR